MQEITLPNKVSMFQKPCSVTSALACKLEHGMGLQDPGILLKFRDSHTGSGAVGGVQIWYVYGIYIISA